MAVGLDEGEFQNENQTDAFFFADSHLVGYIYAGRDSSKRTVS
jgi:hypothetical protein